MEKIDFKDFYSGGYFLLRSDRPDWPPPFGEFLPDGNLISLSACICRQRLSVHWGWIPGDRDAALTFGIPEKHLTDFLEWCRSEYPDVVDMYSMFYTIQDARNFVERFELNTENLLLIGAGLPKELHRVWLEKEFDNEGIAKRIKQAIPIEKTGDPLGFDVVSYSYHDFGHSWLCSGLEQEMNDLFGIRANSRGLIDAYIDAKKVYEWIAEDEEKGRRGEPEPYYFWLLMSYPLEV